jgi:hypothetical protein
MYVTRTYTHDELMVHLADNYRGADVIITDANGKVAIGASDHAYLTRTWREGTQVAMSLVSALSGDASVYRLDPGERVELGWFENA